MKACLICGSKKRLESPISNKQTPIFNKWRRQCVRKICKLFQLDCPKNEGYEYLMCQRLLCELCIETVRDMDMILEQMTLMEKKLLAGADVLKLRLQTHYESHFSENDPNTWNGLTNEFEKVPKIRLKHWNSKLDFKNLVGLVWSSKKK